MIDIHSHILPGIDDGAVSIEDSIAMLEELAGHGVTDVIATPHFMNETAYVSPRSVNKKVFTELKGKIKSLGIKINIYLGNEIYIDKDISRLIEDKKITTLSSSKYLLVELPLNGEFSNYEDYLGSLVNDGYQVILAHPERYSLFQEDYERVLRLHEKGVLYQCNLGSLTNKYGKSAKKLVKRLIKDDLIFAFGSDIHRPGRGEYLEKALKKLAKYYDGAGLKKVLESNPRRIIK